MFHLLLELACCYPSHDLLPPRFLFENLGLTISHGERYGLAERLSAGTKLAAYEVTDSLITCIASDIAVLSDDTETLLRFVLPRFG